MFPQFLLSPVAGVMADRYNRKIIMIGSDLLRLVVILGIFLVPSVQSIWLIYGIIFVQAALSIFFEPARTAMIPDIVDPKDLVKANALGSMMWSLMLTFGSALGGVLTEAFGWQVVVGLDALSYIISAILIARINDNSNQTEAKTINNTHSGFRSYLELISYLRTEKRIFYLSILKTLLCFGGASTLILTMYGQKIFTIGLTASIGISIFYAARGVGTFFGPIIARIITNEDPRMMRIAILCSFAQFGIFYMLLSFAEEMFFAAFCVALAHMAGSIIWVFSNVLLQFEVKKELRGRVFGFDLGTGMLSITVVTLLYGFLIENVGINVRTASLIMGATLFIGFGIWHRAMRKYFSI